MTLLNKAKVASQLQLLPSLPGVVSELLSSFANDDVDVDLVARQIAHDQALTARVLRVANSSFYGLQNKVGTIQEAVVVLGFRAVRSMVLAVGMSGVLRAEQCKGFDAVAYQRHCIGVGIAAWNLAEPAGVNRDLAFTGGLLHDIGKLALAANFPFEYAEVLEYRRKHDCFLVVAERDLLGMDHAEVGGMLAEAWHFPKSLHQAVAEHHSPAAATADSLANLIHVADVTAYAMGLLPAADDLVMPLDRVAWERSSGDWLAYGQALPKIEKGYEEACLILI